MRFLPDCLCNRARAQGCPQGPKILHRFKAHRTSGTQGIQSREQYFAKAAKLQTGDTAAQKRAAEGRAPIPFLGHDRSICDMHK